MRVGRRLAVMVVPLCLQACLGGNTTDFIQYDVSGVPQLFSYVASRGEFRTVIHGNPSVAPKEAFEAAVIDTMQGHTWGPKANFSTSSSADARDGYRVVMVFSGQYHITGEAACRGADLSALPPAANRVQLQAAFCFKDRVLSQAHVTFNSFSSPEDPVLNDAVAEAVLHLFPLRDPDREDRGGVFPP